MKKIIILFLLGLIINKSFGQVNINWKGNYNDDVVFSDTSKATFNDSVVFNSVIYENGVYKDTSYFSGDTLIQIYNAGADTIRAIKLPGSGGLDESVLQTFLTDSSYLRMQDTVSTIYTHYKGDSLSTQLRSDINDTANVLRTEISAAVSGLDSTWQYITILNGIIMPSNDTLKNMSIGTDTLYFNVNGQTFKAVDSADYSGGGGGGIDVSALTEDNDADTIITKDGDTLKYVPTVAIPYGQYITAYASGAAYSLTASSALMDFGTTDPTVNLTDSGTYKITAGFYYQYSGATFGSNQGIFAKLRRTNNTATDISNSGIGSIVLNVETTFTGGGAHIALPPVFYNTSNTDDIISLFGSLSATPSAGSIDVTDAYVIIERIY